MMTKRMFDVLVSLVFLILLAPLLLVISLGIALADPGPILYRARRIGLDGSQFVMLKFRTMRVDADRGSSITSADDPRVFRLGALLRVLKFDELPQLWNILRGDMSFVGPRPEDPGIVERYYTPEYRKSLRVRPGLTSPGSLYFYVHSEESLLHGSAEADYADNVLPKKMNLDLEYIDKQGFTNDLAIILRTAAIIVGQILNRRKKTVE